MSFKTEIPLYYLTIQIELSVLVEKIQGISAGLLTLYDIININKQTRKGELNNFFMVMEVYGCKPEVNSDFNNIRRTNENEDQLSLLRIKSLDELT